MSQVSIIAGAINSHRYCVLLSSVTLSLPSVQNNIIPPIVPRVEACIFARSERIGHGFFNAGVCDDTWFYDFIGNSMIRGLGNRRLCMSMVRGMGLHRIKNSEV